MRRLILCLALLMVVSTIPMAMADDDHNRSHRVRTHLSGFNEVHFVAGRQPHCVALSPRRQAASSWPRSMKKAKNPLQAELQGPGRRSYTGHIHFGQRHTVGGIVVWLCRTTRATLLQPRA